MDAKLKHLEMIQGVISRMASNSFLIKGWCITIIAALFVLAEKDTNANITWIPLISTFFFWVLDGYFLSQERAFRGLYDSVRTKDDKDIDFSMNHSRFLKKENSWGATIWSRTLVLFYLPILLIVLIVLFIF